MGHEESVKKETAKPERPSSGASSEEAPRQEKPQPAPPSAKKLCRTDYDKMLAGVCGGVGEYFNIDSSIVRLIFVISSFVYLIGVVAYIVLTILLPVKLTPEEEC
ncbi:MAG: PspC domain-containing protein [Candidatus Omnitrophica bacterium]|nr:PspC domain-containing protein [Candidatus Omnitrophota bacterium]